MDTGNLHQWVIAQGFGSIEAVYEANRIRAVRSLASCPIASMRRLAYLAVKPNN